MENSVKIFLYFALGFYILMFLLVSCSVIEDYKYVGEETIYGTFEHEFNLHEHFKDCDSSHQCFYYHDTIVENFELTIDNLKKVKRLVWYKKSY